MTEYWPTKEWRTSTPEQQGMDSEQLAQMIEFVEKAGVDLHSLLVIRNGYIVAEVYFYPFRQDAKHQVLCVTKSVVSTLMGIAIEEGYVGGVNQRVLDLFSERSAANSDARKEAMTLEHLLTMTSGLDWFVDHIRFDMFRSKDPVQFVLDRPMVEGPGTQFRYNTGNTYLLSTLLSQIIDTDPLSFAQERLFDPLGISDVYWESDKHGVLSPSDLSLTLRDMAKLGYLYLNDGVWDEQQVVPADWVAASVKEHADTTWGQGYGYQWVVWPFGAYAAQGHGGQCVFVVPELEIVFASTGGLPVSVCDIPADLVEDYVIPATESLVPLPDNPEALTRLQSTIERVGWPPKPEPVPSLPEMAQNISSKIYILEDNDFGWQSFTLDFQQDEAQITLTTGQEMPRLLIGLDGVYRMVEAGQLGTSYYGILLSGPVGLRGLWKDDNVFLLNMQFLSGGYFDLQFDFDESTVNLQVKDPVNRAESLHGVLQD